MYCMQQMLVVGSTLPIELSLRGLVHRSCSAAAEFFWPAGNNPSCTVRIFTGWIRKPEPKNAGTSRVLGWCVCSVLLSNPHSSFLLPLVCERKLLGSGALLCSEKPHRYLPGIRGVWSHICSCRGRRPLPGRQLLYRFPRAGAENKMGWVLQEDCACLSRQGGGCAGMPWALLLPLT